MNKTLVALAGIAALLVISYFGYDLLAPNVNRCEGIFQQTAPGVEANVKFLESKGGVVLGRQQIQALSDRAQEVALNLKSCCVMAESGNFEQFRECKASAVLYDQRVAQAVETIKTVNDATATEQAQKQKEAEARLAAIIQSAAEASAALQKQVDEISEGQSGSSAPSANSTNAPSASSAPQGPGTLRLRAALTNGGELVNACFDIFHPQEDLQGNREHVARSCSDSANFELPGGPYVAFATAGQATVRSDITISPGQTIDQIIDLDAGYLRSRAELIGGGEQVDACFDVYESKQDLEGNRKQVARSCTDQALFLLPVGDYLLNVQSGQASVSTAVKITAGGLVDQSAALNAGYLRTYAELISGGEQVQACFDVFETKTDLQGNYKQIARTCTDNALLILPAGDYTLSAQSGNAMVSVGATIAAGQATKLPVVLNAGYLRLQAQLGGDTQLVNACFDVYEPTMDVHGNRKQVARSCTEKAVFTLPSGDYVLVSQAGDANAEQTAEVKAGTITDHVMTLTPP